MVMRMPIVANDRSFVTKARSGFSISSCNFLCRLSFLTILLFSIITIKTFYYFVGYINIQNVNNVIEVNSENDLNNIRRDYRINGNQYKMDLYKASRGLDHKMFYRRVKIEAFCKVKERIGETEDGGKYVCNPTKVKKENCTLISLGLNNQIGYDKHIQNVTGGHCKILGADKNTQKYKTRQAYEQMNGQLFAGKIPDKITISEMLSQAGREDVELLKIDIEGGEFKALEPLIKDSYVCQIFIEVHGTPADHLNMLQIMATYGFRIFNVDENPLCITCCEYSLINELCMLQFEVTPLGELIPAKNQQLF